MSAEAVAIFFDEDELGQLIDGWPEGMRLAVCLDAGGGCAMVVHHRTEDDGDVGGTVLRRVGEALGRPVGGFAVVPARHGLPTRRMMFSEERQLMRLVTDSDDLLEFATDYALNYAYAAEEGLDIEAIVTGRARPKAPARGARPAPEVVKTPAPAPAARTPEPRPELPDPPPAPAAHATAAPAAPRLPDGFRALAPEEQDHSLFTDAMLSLGVTGQVQLKTATTGADDPGVEIAEVYFRDDLLSFAIPIRALADCDRLPAMIVLNEALMPRAMVASLAQGPQAVRLTATGAHLFVGLAPARAAATSPLPVRETKTRTRPRRSLAARILRGGLGGGALAAGLLLALQIGLSPAFSHTDAKTAHTSLRDMIFAPNGQ